MRQTPKKRTWSLALAAALAAALMAPAAAWAAGDGLTTGGQGATTVTAQAAKTYDTDYKSPTPTKKGQVVSDGTFALVSASDADTLKKVVGVKGNSKGKNSQPNHQ